MQSHRDSPTFSPDQEDYLLTLAAMFETEFSIDWLEELTSLKASAILCALEEEVEKGALSRRRPAIYIFAHPQRRQELIGGLSDEEKGRYCRSIAAILARELPEDDAKSLEIARHLLHISNGWEGCEWLVRAGEIYMESFRTEDATRCFAKVLSDLSAKRGENEDWLFVKAAIEYSNITTGKSNTIETLSLLRDAKGRARPIEPSYDVFSRCTSPSTNG